MAPEDKVKNEIKKILNEYGVFYEMHVPCGYGNNKSLDFTCCAFGYYLAIEAKAPGKKPTGRQERAMDKRTQAGGYVLLVDGGESLGRLRALLDELIATDLL